MLACATTTIIRSSASNSRVGDLSPSSVQENFDFVNIRHACWERKSSSIAYPVPYQDSANNVMGGVIPSRVEGRVWGPS